MENKYTKKKNNNNFTYIKKYIYIQFLNIL